MIGIGAFAGSPDDGGISDSFFPENTFTLAQATVPPANPVPSPPILINPHEHRIIDTNHRDLIRVSVFGTSGFPVSDINPSTVELDGVHVDRAHHPQDQQGRVPVRDLRLCGRPVDLPAGLTTATLTGKTKSGVTFVTQKDVLNIPDSARVFGRLRKYMGGGSFYEAVGQARSGTPRP